MSKGSRALQQQKKSIKRNKSYNSKKRQKYKSLAGTQSAVPPDDPEGQVLKVAKSKHLTKAQKKRKHMGKDPKGACGGINIRSSHSTWDWILRG